MPEITLAHVAACHDWPLGECKFGWRCTREHHPNLDPALVEMKAQPEYSVPKEVGEACQRCMQRLYPCDKKGRGGQDDPCSECRWFGGENCRCTLLQNSSLNDQIWALMIRRGAGANYTLPAHKDRMQGTLTGPIPSPMPATKVKVNWQGETKEALLAKGDMLYPDVREHPRAYLVPPPPPAARESEVLQGERKRKLEPDSEASNDRRQSASLPVPTMGFATPQFPPSPPFPRPPAHPIHGKVLVTSYDWDSTRWTHRYESGVTVTGPPTTPGVRASPQ